MRHLSFLFPAQHQIRESSLACYKRRKGGTVQPIGRRKALHVAFSKSEEPMRSPWTPERAPDRCSRAPGRLVFQWNLSFDLPELLLLLHESHSHAVSWTKYRRCVI